MCVSVCVHVLLSASPQHFVKEPDGVHSHHSEFWRLPAATSCYLLSPIKCHFLPPPLIPFLSSLLLFTASLPSSSPPMCTVDFFSFTSGETFVEYLTCFPELWAVMETCTVVEYFWNYEFFCTFFLYISFELLIVGGTDFPMC